VDNILTETQEQRDIELSEYTRIPLEEIRSYVIGARKSIMIHTEGDIDKDDYSYLYKEYKHLNDAEYLKTLAAFTVTRRARYILALEKILGSFDGLKVLDFGCGTGSHGIFCSQVGAKEVTFLDVDGPLYNYAKWRCEARELTNVNFLTNEDDIPVNEFDVVICMDVLEHVASPISVFNHITDSLKPGGLIALEVSTMKRATSGHFIKSINEWVQLAPAILKKKYTPIQKHIWRLNDVKCSDN
jgi:2-polyprenyl-3-methyl-5-hydroxy-6-metoxy-1,4-benzoquinol methylase